MKRILALLLALSAVLLCACSKDDPAPAEPTPPVFDAADYVRGGLDAVYLGTFSDEYLAMLGQTEDDCRAAYERGMQVSLEVFAQYFSISPDKCSDTVKDSLLELMRTMYKTAKYTVGEVKQTDDGYTVEVTVEPIAAVKLAAEKDYPEFSKTAAQRISSGELNRDDSSFADWWAGEICAMVSARLQSPEYLEAQTVTVTLAKNDAGAFAFSGSSLSDVDALILAF